MRPVKTIVLKADARSLNKKIITQAAQAIRDGKLVAFPTETVYGIAANRLDAKAMGSLRAVKNRPDNKPFTVHISDTAMIKKMGCVVTQQAKILIDRFWPGPLTIILKADTGEKIGFRMPANIVALELIAAAGVPVVAPSANASGALAPTRPEEVLKELDGLIDILIDAGPADVGIESTVVDLTTAPPKILRQGAIKKEELNKVLDL
jgi:L-threonylcarbamoyladenylate synthase